MARLVVSAGGRRRGHDRSWATRTIEKMLEQFCAAHRGIALAFQRLSHDRGVAMRPLSDDTDYASPVSAQSDELDLHARVSAEFREMPGLKLTLAQAARLFSIDSTRCERVFGALVERGELSTDGRAWARADTGRRGI
jgi:hypothetical protein